MDTSSFGVELRRLRIAAGLSLSEFASLVNYSKGYLSKIETGAMPPTADLARRCDARLGANGSLSALRQEIPRSRAAGSTVDSAVDVGAEVWVMTLSPDGNSTFVPMRRREVLFGGAMALAGLAVAPHRTASSVGGAELVAAHRDMFDQTRRFGQVTSPHLVLPHVIAQAHMLRALAGGTRGAEHDQLMMLASRNAEYAGWMAQETGDERAAMWWTATAVRLAAEAGDHDLAVYALVRQASIALHRGDARATVELAARAQVDPRVPPRIRGLAAQREGQGHALAGDHARCLRALDRAEELLTAATEPTGAPLLGSTFIPRPVTLARAWSLYDLGRPAEAAAIFDREVPRIPRMAVRGSVHYGTRHALAHAAAGDVEHACALVAPLLALARQIESETVLTDLRLLAATLRRWPRHPAVIELTPELTAALHPSRVA